MKLAIPKPFQQLPFFKRLKQNRPPSPRPRPRKEGDVFNRLGGKERSASARSDSRYQVSHEKETEIQPRKHHHRDMSSRETGEYSESEDSEGGHWKSKSRRHRSNTYEDDLSQPWTREERNPFTPCIWHFNFPRTRMPSHVKTYDGSGDPEDHLKLFQAAAKTESYEDLRTAFRENYLQQTKHIKDPVEIHHIKQRDGESTEDFMERYKAEILDVEGAPECMKISGFMHGITHPELIKRLYEKIPRSMDEMYRVTTSFLQGEVAAFSHSRKKAPASWKQPEGGNKPNFKKGFKNKQRSDRKPDRFSLLTKTPKEIFALEKGKFKAPPPMVTPAEKKDPNKYYEFHADTGHNTDECMQLRKQIDEMIKSSKLSQFIKELKQNDKPKVPKKGETAGKDKPLAILMIQPWEKVAKQRVTQSFSPETIISFPSLGEEDGTEGPMVIEAEIGRHSVHRMYVDGGASSEVLYEHCFVRLQPEIRSQMIPATTSLIGFSGETIWPIGQISLLARIGDEEHSTSAWMNFMVIRSPSQHNGIIGRTGIRKIQKGSKELCALLRQNLDIFAWRPADMTGVPRHMAEHHLNVRGGCPPVKQKKRGQAPERNKAIQMEVEKLVDAGIMKEVHYHSWLSNPEGMFLGYKVNTEGLKVCPDKADAVLSLPSLGCLKDVQKLNGQLASLNRFLSKSAEKSLPFFKTLKKCTKKGDFQWTQEAEIAFKQMKKLIAELPMLTAPKEKEELIMYLAAAKEAISAVLMTERGGKQLPVYFVSRALRGPEINYTPMEKLVLALLSASRRLKRYFQAHTIVVITDQPIKQLLSKSEISGRMLKWKFELEGYDIQYRPRTSIKGQILADFIVERPDEESPDEPMAEPEELPEPWTLFTDGSSCVDGSGAGLILTNPDGVEFTYAMRFRFEATNNEAEYEALIAGLRIAEQMGVKNLQANVDSRLVANQVNDSYIAKESVPRNENKKANALSKIASTSFAHLSKQVLMEELKEKSIHEKEVLAIVEEEGQTWMTPICEYLTKEILPENKKKARAVRRKASRYTMINGTLYKKSFLGPWLRFGLPREIVSDNGKQFRDNPFKDWSLGEVIKARLDERSKDWIRELSHVLWAHHTMIKSSNEETPFSLTYGTEAVIPA
ncbi:reverse transcriptase domain-containing protein [Tanacetum coccineum]|uniref:Reverse transcriptase domain-containing protein n=1 Tax=Tanacetum coccineum TaxID=301880 RepID=A0ABQ4WAL4_9ASTR